MKPFPLITTLILGLWLCACSNRPGPTATPAPASAPAPTLLGGDISGGGSVVQSPTQGPVLLDLFLAPGFQRAKDVGKPLDGGPFLKDFGFAWWDTENDPDFLAAIERVALWRKAAPHISRILVGVLYRNLRFFHTDRPLRQFQEFWLPDDLRRSGPLNVRTLVSFDPLLGPIIDTRLWNELDSKSRAATFIHEALRHLRTIHPDALTEEQLERLTARLMLDDPETVKAHPIESPEYVGQVMMEIFRLPTWKDIAEMSEGVRFRLYYRWVTEHIPALRERLAAEPGLDELKKSIQERMEFCGPLIRENFEIDCAASFTVDFPLWRKQAAGHPKLEAELARLELRSGQLEYLWQYQGEPGFIHMFYHRLIDRIGGPKVPNEIVKTWPHPLEIRDFLTTPEKLSPERRKAVESSLPTLRDLFQRYFARSTSFERR